MTMTRNHLATLLSIAALTAACGGADTTTVAASDAAAPKQTAKSFTAPEGHKLSLELDEAGKVVGTSASDHLGKPLPTRELSFKDATVCIPRAPGAKSNEPLCQPLAALSDGAFLKMGTATCRCQTYMGKMYCYGDTCF